MDNNLADEFVTMLNQETDVIIIYRRCPYCLSFDIGYFPELRKYQCNKCRKEWSEFKGANKDEHKNKV